MFANEITTMSNAFMAQNPEGVFVAYRFQQPPHINTSRSHANKRPETKAVPIKPGDLFERQGTTYQMFRMYETIGAIGCNTIAVAYYDKAAAEADGKDLQYFLKLSRRYEDSNFENLHPEYLMVSHHDEVIRWVNSVNEIDNEICQDRQPTRSSFSRRRKHREICESTNSTPAICIGTKVWKDFDDGIYMGKVIAYDTIESWSTSHPPPPCFLPS